MKQMLRNDMTEGPLLGKMIRYAIPVILTGILQLLFNAADMIVVGRYAGNDALAAVGATGTLINLIVNLAMGLSVGTAVTTAQYYGAKDRDGVRKVVSTSMATAIVAGLIVMAIGFFGCEVFLGWMDTPKDVIKMSALYMRIYFLSMPACMIYNFCAAVLRSAGDTRHPLLFLTISGAVNVIMNLLFVIGFKMDVDGVALATLISQMLSAALVVIHMVRIQEDYRLDLKHIRFYKKQFLRLLRIGLPAGLQSSMFSISNVLIQSSVNSFGSAAVAGNSADSSIEGFIYVSMNALHQTVVTFAGQNAGAKKYARINRILALGIAMVTVIGALLGFLILQFGEPLLSLFTKADDPETPQAIEFALERMKVIASTYFLCGIMEVFNGALRGLGASLSPMIMSLVGVCGFRVVWIYTAFRVYRTPMCLYLSYPISWASTTLALAVVYTIMICHRIRRAKKESLPQSA